MKLSNFLNPRRRIARNSTSPRRRLRAGIDRFRLFAEPLEDRRMLANPGDIVYIGVDTASGGPTGEDSFAFVTLADIPAGEVFFFSDGDRDATTPAWGQTNSADGAMTFAVPAGGLLAGHVVRLVGTTSTSQSQFTSEVGNSGTTGGGPGTVTIGVAQGASITDFAPANSDVFVNSPNDSDFNLSSAGDTMVIYQGSTASPTFISAMQTKADNWVGFGAGSNSSDVPEGLTDGVDAVAVGTGPGFGDEADLARYTGPTSGTKAQLLATISDNSNWERVASGGNFADGTDDVTNGAGTGPGAYTVTVRPEVVDVLVSGDSWNIDPVSLLLGADAAAPQPWINLDRIHIVFSTDVSVTVDDLALVGLNVPEYTFTRVEYDNDRLTATWSLDSPLGADRLRLSLAGEIIGLSSTDSLSGVELVVGENFEFDFDVLPGDSTGDGVTDISDLVNIATRVPASIGSPPDPDFAVKFDVNGDGTIDIGDLVNVATRVPSSLPAGAPGKSAPSAVVTFQAIAPTIRPGDANRDMVFNQLDLVKVLWAGKYVTGAPANWSEGDWNGDSMFDQSDIMAALRTRRYLNPDAAAIG